LVRLVRFKAIYEPLAYLLGVSEDE
jgi:hypothetical protein